MLLKISSTRTEVGVFSAKNKRRDVENDTFLFKFTHSICSSLLPLWNLRLGHQNFPLSQSCPGHAANGDLKLQASEAARTYRPPPFTLALDGMTVTRNARQWVEVLGTRESLRGLHTVPARAAVWKVPGPDVQMLENDLGWVTGVTALVDLDDTETEAQLSRNKFRLLTYVKRFPEVVAQMESKQRGIEEERRRRKKVSMPAATATKPAPPKKGEEMDEAKMDSILSSGK